MTQTLIEKLRLMIEDAFELNLGSKCGDGYFFRTEKERETIGEFARRIAENAVEECKATEQVPLGYVDEFGNFENSLKQWMIDEPNVKWSPLFTHPQLPDETVKDAAIGKLVREKMQSGNDVPVSRCVITKEEFDAF